MTLTLSALQKASVERNAAFGKCDDWTLADWMQALVGEVGETANLMKKVRRGDFTLDDIRQELAHEIADIQCYLPLLAHFAGVDLEAAAIDKFNVVSEQMGSIVKLGGGADGFWYLASPYSRYPGGLEAAFDEVVKARGLLVKVGVRCFSPIIHSHPVAVACDIDPFDHSIWLPAEEPILRAAKGLIMLKMTSWESSYGMECERKAFIAAGKPIVWMEPGIVPDSLL